MGYIMKIYGVNDTDDDLHLKELVSWRNHYFLDTWISDRCNGGNSTEDLYIPFDAIDVLEEDCNEAISFLKNHVSAHRLHLYKNPELCDEWEYEWDAEIPDNIFFKESFEFYLHRYGNDGFIGYLELITEFIQEYKGEYDFYMYNMG